MTTQEKDTLSQEIKDLKVNISNTLAEIVPEIDELLAKFPEDLKIENDEQAQELRNNMTYCDKANKFATEKVDKLLEPLTRLAEIKKDAWIKANSDLESYRYFIESKISQVELDGLGNPKPAAKKMNILPLKEPRFSLVRTPVVIKSRMENIYKVYQINKIKEAEAERLRLEQLAKEQAAQIKQQVLDNSTNAVDALDALNKVDNALTKVEQAIISETKVSSTTKTLMGAQQDRKIYKLSTMDKAKILRWVLNNPEHLDLVDINTAYANANFKPSSDPKKPKPIQVDGLEFELDLSIIHK